MAPASHRRSSGDRPRDRSGTPVAATASTRSDRLDAGAARAAGPTDVATLLRLADGGSRERLAIAVQASHGNAGMISLLGAGTRIHGLPAHLRAGLASDVLDNLGGDMGGGATETEGENDDTTSKPTPTASGTSISVAEAPFTVAGEFTAMAANLAARPEAGSVSSQVTDLYYEPPTGRVKLAHVTVVETRALPIWTERGTPKPEQVTEWDRFRAAIAVHEQGHVDIDMKTFANAHRKAIGLSQADANTNIDGVVTAANNANHDYDTDNDHGRKAGTKIDGNVGVGMIKVP